MGTRNEYSCTSCGITEILEVPAYWCIDCGAFTDRELVVEENDSGSTGIKGWDAEPICPDCNQVSHDGWRWDSPCPQCGEGIQREFPEKLRETDHDRYECYDCGYSAEYAQKIYANPTRVKSTFLCRTCHEIFVFEQRPIFPTREEAEARRNRRAEISCATCHSQNVQYWSSNKPCPRCGGVVQDLGVAEFYDGPEMFD
jgi:predicted RNA-binding Zn-ribbon protein involved in translation (DUF1610 family)